MVTILLVRCIVSVYIMCNMNFGGLYLLLRPNKLAMNIVIDIGHVTNAVCHVTKVGCSTMCHVTEIS
jgi:hypothetical protein